MGSTDDCGDGGSAFEAVNAPSSSSTTEHAADNAKIQQNAHVEDNAHNDGRNNEIFDNGEDGDDDAISVLKSASLASSPSRYTDKRHMNSVSPAVDEFGDDLDDMEADVDGNGNSGVADGAEWNIGHFSPKKGAHRRTRSSMTYEVDTPTMRRSRSPDMGTKVDAMSGQILKQSTGGSTISTTSQISIQSMPEVPQTKIIVQSTGLSDRSHHLRYYQPKRGQVLKRRPSRTPGKSESTTPLSSRSSSTTVPAEHILTQSTSPISTSSRLRRDGIPSPPQDADNLRHIRHLKRRLENQMHDVSLGNHHINNDDMDRELDCVTDDYPDFSEKRSSFRLSEMSIDGMTHSTAQHQEARAPKTRLESIKSFFNSKRFRYAHQSWAFNVMAGFIVVLFAAAATFMLLYVFNVHTHLILKCSGSELIAVLVPYLMFLVVGIFVAMQLVKNIMDRHNVSIAIPITATAEKLGLRTMMERGLRFRGEALTNALRRGDAQILEMEEFDDIFQDEDNVVEHAEVVDLEKLDDTQHFNRSRGNTTVAKDPPDTQNQGHFLDHPPREISSREYLEELQRAKEERQRKQKRALKIITYSIKTAILVIGLIAWSLLIAVAIFLLIITFSSLPNFGRTYTLNGLRGEVTINREESGVVHIVADTDIDMFFAQGFVAAQERLFQMEFNKRVARGTLSEMVGSYAVDIDIFSRTIGFYSTANETLSSMNKKSLEILQAFSNGINAYVDSFPTLSPEFGILIARPTYFEPVDVLAWTKLLSWSLSMNGHKELQRYRLLQRGLSIERVMELTPLYPKSNTTVVSAEDLGLQNMTASEIDAIESKHTDHSGAYIPQTILNTFDDKGHREMSSIESTVSRHETQCHHNNSRPWWWTLLMQKLGKFLGKNMEQKTRNSINQNLNDWKARLLLNEESFKASNNWVLAGSMARNGKPLLANDPHLSFTSPMIWYLVHLQSKESDIDAIGAAFPNSPMVIVGRNQHVSWGVTNAGTDAQDYYVLHESQDGFSYIFKSEFRRYKLREEEIHVFGESSRTVVVKESVYGPVVNDAIAKDIPQPLALSWISLEKDDTTMNGFVDLMFSKNWVDFRNALRQFVAPSQNFVYADTNNNIGYSVAGRVPIRKQGHSGAFPVSGNGTFAYDGMYVPFDDLPSVYNPDRGYIVSANNRIAPLGYGFNLGLDYASPARAERIEEMIISFANETEDEITLANMISMQMDIQSRVFKDLSFVFETMVAFTDLSEQEYEKWRKRLTTWGGNESFYSREASVFESFLNQMGKLGADETGLKEWKNIMYITNALKYEDTACFTMHKMTCHDYARHAFRNAIVDQEHRFGSVSQWGDIHTVKFPSTSLSSTALDCLASRTIHTGGGTHTVNVADVNSNFVSHTGASYRQIIDMGLSDDDRNGRYDRFIMPMGMSENMYSTRYDNWLGMWKDGMYLDMRTSGYNVGVSQMLSPPGSTKR